MKIYKTCSENEFSKFKEELAPYSRPGSRIFFKYLIIKSNDNKNYRIVRFNLFEKFIDLLFSVPHRKSYLKDKIKKNCKNYKLIPGTLSFFYLKNRPAKSPRKENKELQESSPKSSASFKKIKPSASSNLKSRQEAFKKQALSLDQSFYKSTIEIEKEISKKGVLKSIKKEITANKDKEKGEFKQGGHHRVFFSKEAPDLVFKVAQKKENRAEKIVCNEEIMSKKARKLCKEKNLYLIYPPRTKAVQLDENDPHSWITVQEKMPMNGHWNYQKGLYRFIQNDPDLKKYSRELFRQLIEFVVEFNLYDVKIDNFPLTHAGIVSLHDLDMDAKKGEGLYVSYAKSGKGGVFKTLSLKKSKNIEAFGKELLRKKDTLKDFKTFDKKVKKLRKKRKLRLKKTNDYEIWAKKRDIEEASQKIKVDKSLIKKVFPNKKERDLALDLIDDFNNILSKTKEKHFLDLRIGRKSSWYLSEFKLSKSRLTSVFDRLKENDLIFNYYFKVDPVDGTQYVNFYF